MRNKNLTKIMVSSTLTVVYSPSGTDNHENRTVVYNTLDELHDQYIDFVAFHPAGIAFTEESDLIKDFIKEAKKIKKNTRIIINNKKLPFTKTNIKKFDKAKKETKKNISETSKKLKQYRKKKNDKFFNPNTGKYVKADNKSRAKQLKKDRLNLKNLQIEKGKLEKQTKKIKKRNKRPEDFKLAATDDEIYCFPKALKEFGSIVIPNKKYTAFEVMDILKQKKINFDAVNLVGETRYKYREGKSKVFTFVYGNKHLQLLDDNKNNLKYLDLGKPTQEMDWNLPRDQIEGNVIFKGSRISMHKDFDGKIIKYETISDKINKENDFKHISIKKNIEEYLDINLDTLKCSDTTQETLLRSVFVHKYCDVKASDKAYDLNRAFTNIITNPMSLWKVYDYSCDWIPTNKYMGIGEYRIETKNFIPFRGNGDYGHQVILLAITEKIKFKIIGFRKPKKLVKKQFFKGIDKLTKDAVNTFIGSLICKKEQTTGYVIDSKSEANSMEKYHGCGVVNTIHNRYLLTKIHSQEDYNNFYHFKDIHNQIIDDNNCMMYNLIKDAGGKLVGIKCDCIIVRGGKKPTVYSVKEEEPCIKQSQKYINNKSREIVYKEWEKIDKIQDICLIHGKAGSGKSRFIKNIDGVVIGAEHSVVQQHQGSTMSKFFSHTNYQIVYVLGLNWIQG